MKMRKNQEQSSLSSTLTQSSYLSLLILRYSLSY